MNAEASAFFGALMSTKFYFSLIKAIEVIAGILFLTNKKVAFGAIIVFPVMVAEFLFHLGLDIGGIDGAAIALIFNIVLIVSNKEK